MVPPDPPHGQPPSLLETSSNASPSQPLGLSPVHTSKSQPTIHAMNGNVASTAYSGPHYSQELNGNTKSSQESTVRNGDDNMIMNNHVHKKSNSSPTAATPQNSINNANNNNNRWKNSLDSLNTQQQVINNEPKI